MTQIVGLIKLARPFTSLTGALTTLAGGYVTGTSNWSAIVLAGIVTYLVSASAIAWNDYLDIEIDKVNQPQRAIPSGLVSPRSAWTFSISLTIAALAIAGFINLWALLFTLLISLVLYFYSWKLKSTVLIGNLTTASIAAASAIFGGIAVGNVKPTFWLAVIIVTAITARELLKVLADYDGDMHQQCRTVATVWGKSTARILFWLIATATLFVMMLPYLLNIYQPVYAYTVALGVYPVIIYIMFGVARRSTGRQLEQLSQILKYDFLIWFLAVFLGAAN